MHNDQDMVIRMIAYDLHFAMQNTASEDEKGRGFVMYFPNSTVIYPAKNNELPEFLRCRIIFQDGSEHIYQIPTVRIQSYSLQEIHKKHLDIFIPYVLLRLRPKLNPKLKHPLTQKELTDFVDEAILILEDELSHGYLTAQEFNDYINLFRFAANKIFKNHPGFREEVDRMTEPMIVLPSVQMKRLRAENDAMRAELAEKDAKLEERNIELAEKNAELIYMKELLDKYNIVTTP